MTAYAMASAALARRAVFAGVLGICLSRGRIRMVLIVPAKNKRKCKQKVLCDPSFFVEPLAKSLGLNVL